ncbi:sigma-54 interaction domain-containing protein [Vreelandella utahensis]|uniref:sigma-54 interaction domain-containing protein n=1 Tax=Vreelandella halophila TaxID=86177 RepID=UPI00098615FE|nr:sigma 54-interacting transcriptional regulator [Halomonas utahensis]
MSDDDLSDVPTMREELVTILEMSKLLEKPLDPGNTIEGILRLIAQLCGLNCGRVALPNQTTGAMEIYHHYGLSEANVEHGRFDLRKGEGVTGHVMRTGSIGLVPDVDDEPLFVRRVTETSGVTSNERLAFIAVPILEAGSPIGVLSVQRETDMARPFHLDISLLRVASAMIGQVLRINEFVEEKTSHLVQENQTLRNTLTAEEMVNNGVAHGVIGSSPTLMDALKQANQVADTEAPILLLGESGTGKEKFARMIHQQSSRSEQPFISINCSAIPADLQEAELFGHVKGSFTGATSAKSGKLTLADGGTLFLDEIGDMPLSLQAKLLRTLQEKQVDPIGATHSIPVDFRLISATHAPLMDYVNQGHFRLDLFYRINVVPIELPALRHRDGDIRRIALHHLNEINHQHNRNAVLSRGALALLESFPWPGNVRQLINVLERAVLTAESNQIDDSLVQVILANEGAINLPERSNPEEFPDTLPTTNTYHEHHDIHAGRRYEWVRHEEAKNIREALHEAEGNKTQAAQLLNLTVRQLRYRIQKLNLDP